MALKRAKELSSSGHDLKVNGPIAYFLNNNKGFDQNAIDVFVQLDDFDIMFAVKMWQTSDDRVLSSLCKMIVERRLPRIKIRRKAFSDSKFSSFLDAFRKKAKLSEHEASYFVFRGEISNQAFNSEDKLRILLKNGKVTSFQKASDQFSSIVMNEPTVRYFMCYPKV